MLNFTYYNPTRILFGKGTIAELERLVPRDNKVLLLFGGGSVRRNGVYDQVRRALHQHAVVERGGIQSNPHYETCLEALATVRAEKVGFLLAVGGGSVIDAAKFIAAAAVYPGDEPWDLIRDWPLVRGALPLGTVLTLPGTGSEMNGGAVISRPVHAGEALLRLRAHLPAVLHPRSRDDLLAAGPAVRQRHDRRLRAGARAVSDL